MAFVNKQGGAEKQEDVAGAGQLIDFDPADPTVIKVHYDLSAWDFDQRAELAEALAGADIPHAWDGEELVVPELVEDATDALFERLEAELGPFPIGLADDDESTEFGLDEWSGADRKVLTEALVESEVPHRWEGTTLLVARDAEDAVDELLDAIEAGELMSADDESNAYARDGVLSEIFLAANKLAKDPIDAKSRSTLLRLDEEIDASAAPYAFAPRTWEQAVAGVGSVAELIRADADGGVTDDEDDSVRERASRLAALVRPFV